MVYLRRRRVTNLIRSVSDTRSDVGFSVRPTLISPFSSWDDYTRRRNGCRSPEKGGQSDRMSGLMTDVALVRSDVGVFRSADTHVAVS
jgi:hypothetical protein